MIRNMVRNVNFFSINFNAKGIKIADWILSVASIAYGGWLLWSGDILWGAVGIALGLVGCFTSWWRPLPRIQEYVRSRFVKPRG
jgi:hypothetical protein